MPRGGGGGSSHGSDPRKEEEVRLLETKPQTDEPPLDFLALLGFIFAVGWLVPCVMGVAALTRLCSDDGTDDEAETGVLGGSLLYHC